MKKRFVRFTGRQAVALLAAALAAGMAWGVVAALAASPSSSPSAGGGKIVLQVGFDQSVDNLNPFIGYQTVSWDVYSLNYDFLVNYDAATLKPVPGVAESWEHSPDGKVWTFHIRHGVTWQDGQPLTAQDVAFTFNYVVDHQMANFTSYTSWIKHVTASDDYTAVFTCSQPKANMLRCGCRSCLSTSGARSAPATPATSSRTRRPSSAAGRSRWSSRSKAPTS